jgi:hypothetical protein
LQDEVLVMALGEFGRTPKINQDAGRDHWPGRKWDQMWCTGPILVSFTARTGITTSVRTFDRRQYESQLAKVLEHQSPVAS